MQNPNGETLASVLRQGPLDIDTAVRYASDIGDALDSVHARGIAHGGVTPATVVITPAGALLLETGARRGQPGGEPLDVRGDVYAFGATCYEMLTGRRPTATPQHPSQLNPAVPVALAAVILRCLAEGGDERPRTIRAALNAVTVAMNETEMERETIPWRYAAGAAAMLVVAVAAGCPN